MKYNLTPNAHTAPKTSKTPATPAQLAARPKNPLNTKEHRMANQSDLTLTGVSTSEAETIIILQRDSDMATISTTDSTVFNKLRKNTASGANSDDSAQYTLEDVSFSMSDSDETHIVEAVFACPKKLISFRSKTVSHELTDEQKEAAAERMRQLRSRQN